MRTKPQKRENEETNSLKDLILHDINKDINNKIQKLLKQNGPNSDIYSVSAFLKKLNSLTEPEL